MRGKRRSTTDGERSFKVAGRRIKSALSDDKTFFWFYVSLHLEERHGAALMLSDLALVEYHLLDDTFPDPDVRVANPANGFEYKFWTYGFIKVSAHIVTRSGEVIPLPPTPLSWDVTPNEIKLNGKSELSW